MCIRDSSGTEQVTVRLNGEGRNCCKVNEPKKWCPPVVAVPKKNEAIT